MIFNMVGGGGTGGASIFIVNSVNQRPTNVFNNTLWVNTDVDAVKCVFSGNEPSNPTEGMLWLIISNSDNVNVAAPINKDWMKFNLGIVRQYIDGAWERKVAQLYKDGIWVDVSRMFSASINITYPANSNCVVTNSGGQTVASDTNTTSSTKTWTATVNATGTYTVTATATDGSGNTKSESVDITSEGQSESVELSYELVLFDGANGGDNIEVTGGWSISGTGSDYSEISSSYLYAANGGGTDIGAWYGSTTTISTKNIIDLSRYSVAEVMVTETNGTSSFKVGSASLSISTPGTYPLDISAVSSGTVAIIASKPGETWAKYVTKATKIRLY